MTLSPTDQAQRYQPARGPVYEHPAECAHPHCHSWTTERHHVWRRGTHGVSGGNDWVLDTETGDLLPNLIGLCSGHHRELTGGIGGHMARVFYMPDDRCFHWLVPIGNEGDWESIGEIRWPTPPRYGASE